MKIHYPTYSHLLGIFLIFLFIIGFANSMKTYALTQHFTISEFSNPNLNKIISISSFIYLPNHNYLSRPSKQYLTITKTDGRITPIVSENQEETQDEDNNKTPTQGESGYYIGYKFETIDLPCNDNGFICTGGEFQKEIFNNKTMDTAFLSSPEVDKNKCGIITNGDISEDALLYLCFTSIEDAGYIQNILTEKIANVINNFPVTLNNLQMLKKTNDGYYYGNITLHSTFGEYNLDLNHKIQIKYDQISSYITNSIKYDITKWKGSPILTPSKSYCFGIDTNVALSQFIFCTFYNNISDQPFTLENSVFTVTQIITKLNQRLHLFHLKQSQTVLKNFDCFNSCDSRILQPIQYEIRFRYGLSKHKLKEMILLNKINKENGVTALNQIKKKIIDRSCIGYTPCVKIVNKCVASGEYKIFKSKKQNKYTYSGINPFNFIIKESYSDALKNTVNANNMMPTSPKQMQPLIPNKEDIVKAAKVFKNIFNFRQFNNEITTNEDVINFCRVYAYGVDYELKRKGDFGTFSMKSEPFFNFIKNKFQ